MFMSLIKFTPRVNNQKVYNQTASDTICIGCLKMHARANFGTRNENCKKLKKRNNQPRNLCTSSCGVTTTQYINKMIGEGTLTILVLLRFILMLVMLNEKFDGAKIHAANSHGYNSRRTQRCERSAIPSSATQRMQCNAIQYIICAIEKRVLVLQGGCSSSSSCCCCLRQVSPGLAK
jgi:hypothetical protein